jgi:hypothetical protein
MPYVYCITFPNGKIYIGSDLTDSIMYFGSPTNDRILIDFPIELISSITLTKKILFFDSNISRSELVKKEYQYIKKYNSNDPTIGYNKT